MLFGTEILTTAQMRTIESAAMQQGDQPGALLMERAGQAVAGQIRLRWPKPGHAVILCGPGNNGGDGYVVARRLRQAGWRITLLGRATKAGTDARIMEDRWRKTGAVLPLTAATFETLPPADTYVDAVFGTGLARPPEGDISAVLNCLSLRVDECPDRLIAVDCPSGLCLDRGIFLGAPGEADRKTLRAGLTITFDSPKTGHLVGDGPSACGKLVVADIGLGPWREERSDGLAPSALTTAIWPVFDIPDNRLRPVSEMLKLLQKPAGGHGHKFMHGHAVIIAGAQGKGAAARLSALAALRIGAGLVTITPPATAMAEHLQPPEALMRRAVDSAQELDEILDDPRVSALCLGPGCGIERAATLLPTTLAAGRPVVLDADAITALSRMAEPMTILGSNCVITPHAGEFSRLFPDLAKALVENPPAGQGCGLSKPDAVREAARRSGATLLLKGPDTVIAAPDGRTIIHSDFDIPWLATAGAGDVLAGLITGLLARGLSPLDATALGTLVHAQAARHSGPGLIADDLPAALPHILRSPGVGS